MSDAIDKMFRWKVNSNTLDATYYYYILKVMRAIEGHSEEMVEALDLIHESKQKSKGLGNITYCHEWYGSKTEMRKMVAGRDVYGGHWEEKCELVFGTVTEFIHDGFGKIALKNANLIEVFFNPSETRLTEDIRNQEVEFYLGFSYDGLRAKNVHASGTSSRILGRTTNTIASVASLRNSKT